MTDQPLEWVFTWPADPATDGVPGFEATYRQVLGKNIWRMADCQINGPVQQKITGARVREILNAAGRGERRAVRLAKLAAAIEEVR